MRYPFRHLLLLTLLGCSGDSGNVQNPPDPPAPQPAVPARLEIFAGDAQTARVATALPSAPSVKVSTASGAAVRGVPVTFAVVAGGGSITGASAVSDAAGVAAVGSWTLGTAAGTNELSATAANLPPVTFRATATPGPPASVQKHEGDAQTARVNAAVQTAPAVRVRDAHANVLPNVAVTFAVAGGGGSVTGANALTNTDGVGRVGSWTLGTAGLNTLTATVAGLPAVTFSATAEPLFYQGPLIETHAHIVHYRSLVPGEGVRYRVDARAGATSAATYVAGLTRNNIKCVVGFHGVSFDNKQAELLEHARRLKSQYPGRFVLLAEIFSGNPLDWFDAARIEGLFTDDLFAGFGEIQHLNEPLGTGSGPRVLPNDSRFLAIYDRLGPRGLRLMSHPASPTGVGPALARNRQLIWLLHGPQVHLGWTSMNTLDLLLQNNPNLYYTIDFSESLPEFLEITKVERGATSAEQFLQAMNANFATYVDRMTTVWKDIIERHPERFLWGTDMAFPPWHWEPAVLDMMVRFSRTFIARLNSGAAENLAYRNAERVFAGCR